MLGLKSSDLTGSLISGRLDTLGFLKERVKSQSGQHKSTCCLYPSSEYLMEGGVLFPQIGQGLSQYSLRM
jgi:hypothetical protein